MGQPAAGQLELGSGSPPAGLARQPVARAPSLRRDYLELELAVKSLSPSLRLSLSNSLVVPAAAGGAGHIPASPRSFDRAVMVAQWCEQRLKTRETRVRTLPWASSGHVTTRSTPTLPDANLRYQEAFDWRKWTKGGCSFLLLSESAQF